VIVGPIDSRDGNFIQVGGNEITMWTAELSEERMARVLREAGARTAAETTKKHGLSEKWFRNRIDEKIMI
jgi:hypothetical protein